MTRAGATAAVVAVDVPSGLFADAPQPADSPIVAARFTLSFGGPKLAFLLPQIPAGLVPQVILLDLNMPLVSGWDFLDLLKRHEVQLQGQCFVYLLTSSMAPADEARAKTYPLVAGVLHKPLDKRQIQQIRDHVLPTA